MTAACCQLISEEVVMVYSVGSHLMTDCLCIAVSHLRHHLYTCLTHLATEDTVICHYIYLNKPRFIAPTKVGNISVVVQ